MKEFRIGRGGSPRRPNGPAKRAVGRLKAGEALVGSRAVLTAPSAREAIAPMQGSPELEIGLAAVLLCTLTAYFSIWTAKLTEAAE